ncbi:MAG: hypothetical protein NUW09_01945 [Deltaproteobacteria bacterium]|nr:hypothetical protein [Deltaproteobacteria bacterium]
MEFYKFKAKVIEINGHQISLKCDDEAFEKLLADLKVHDRVDVVLSKPQIEDLQEYVKEFNKVFSR